MYIQMTTQEGSRFFFINVVVIAIVDYRFYIRGCFVLGVIIVVCFFFFNLGPLSSLTTKTLESHQFQESYKKNVEIMSESNGGRLSYT